LFNGKPPVYLKLRIRKKTISIKNTIFSIGVLMRNFVIYFITVAYVLGAIIMIAVI